METSYIAPFVLFAETSPARFDPSRGKLRTSLLTLAHDRAVGLVRSEQPRRSREEREDLKVVRSTPSIEDEVGGRRSRLVVESRRPAGRRVLETRLAQFPTTPADQMTRGRVMSPPA